MGVDDVVLFGQWSQWVLFPVQEQHINRCSCVCVSGASSRTHSHCGKWCSTDPLQIKEFTIIFQKSIRLWRRRRGHHSVRLINRIFVSAMHSNLMDNGQHSYIIELMEQSTWPLATDDCLTTRQDTIFILSNFSRIPPKAPSLNNCLFYWNHVRREPHTWFSACDTKSVWHGRADIVNRIESTLWRASIAKILIVWTFASGRVCRHVHTLTLRHFVY